MNKSTITSIIVVVAVVILGLVLLQNTSQKERVGEYDALASCIAESGATFYGAFWCPNCNNQKDLFGKSDRLLPYIECSTPNGQGQTQVCTDAGIQNYPTWEFADGSRLIGTQQISTIAEKTSCEAFLPENMSETETEESETDSSSPITNS